MRIPLIGYAPDVDPNTSGAIVEMTDILPTVRGMKGCPSPVNGGFAAVSEAVNSLAVVTKLDGSRRTFAGTNTTLQELVSSTWTDRSDVGGYTVGVDNRWGFDQFGDVTIAACKAETLQASTSGAFAAISGAPKASWVAISDGFVMVADTNDGTYGDQSDRWWCSAYLDYTDWTPAVSTQCTTGRIVDTPGPIRAMKAFGSGFVMYKDYGIYVGTYIGAPLVWQWDKVPGEVGCPSHNAIVDVGPAHFFISYDDIYAFDGSRPVPIGGPIREWFFADYDSSKGYRVIGTYDLTNGNVWWFYCSRSNADTTPDKAIIYNIRTQKWGKLTLSVEAVARYYGQDITYHDLGTLYSTYDDLPTDISFDSPYWTPDNPTMALFQTDHVLYQMSGAAGSTAITINNIGDDIRYSTIRRVTPRFYTEPDSSTLEYSYDDQHGDNFTLGVTATYDTRGRYDLLHSSRWHRCNLKFSGDVEIITVDVDLVADGED